jgi:hypothetical protein
MLGAKGNMPLGFAAIGKSVFEEIIEKPIRRIVKTHWRILSMSMASKRLPVRSNYA